MNIPLSGANRLRVLVSVCASLALGLGLAFHLSHHSQPTVKSANRQTAPPNVQPHETAQSPNETTRAHVSEAYGQLPLRFEVNEGQTAAPVKFLARGDGYGLFLTAHEAVLALHQRTPTERTPALHKTKAAAHDTVLRMSLAGANPAPACAGLEQLPGASNYFIGRTSQEWHTETPAFARVQYRQVYPGVDLIYYGNQRQLEYDFHVAPGADPRQIKLAISGAEQMRVDEHGDLVLRTRAGDVRQHKPIIYQETAGSRQLIAGRYVLDAQQHVGFEVEQYDTTRPLVIDPVLGYSTLLGGGDADYGTAIAIDATGHAYIAGITRSLNFPTTPGAVQGGLVQGDIASDGNFFSDVFITKLNPAGSAIVYSTYLGGRSQEEATGIAVDNAGNVYLGAARFRRISPRRPALIKRRTRATTTALS
jgi:hypothetical protein